MTKEKILKKWREKLEFVNARYTMTENKNVENYMEGNREALRECIQDLERLTE